MSVSEKSHPQLHNVEEGADRKVTWLELFYDLMYVVAIGELANLLSHDISLTGVVSFILIFVPLWWSWIGTTFYNNRFDSDDPIQRVLMFAQIFAVAVITVNIHDALGDTATGFALGYALVRGILVLMYLRAGYHLPDARKLCQRYATGFTIAAAIWLVSAFVPSPARYVMWIIGWIIDFYTPLSSRSRELQAALPPSPHHLPERFGLFTIIVFGEAFVKVISGLTEIHASLQELLVVIPALVIAASLWWIYFDSIIEAGVRWGHFAAQIWIYMHLPLQLALTMLSVGIYALVTAHPGESLPDPYRWVLCGSLGASLLFIAALERMAWRGTASTRTAGNFALRIGAAVVVLLLGLFGGSIEVTILMIILAILCAAQVVYHVYNREGEHGVVLREA
jgi:low temperature requirement protein LtrA